LRKSKIVGIIGAAVCVLGVLLRLFARNLSWHQVFENISQLDENQAAALGDIGIALLYAGLAFIVVSVAAWLFMRDAKVQHDEAEPSAAPNGGPAPQLGNSGLTEGPHR
jgi:hypothetical protein